MDSKDKIISGRRYTPFDSRYRLQEIVGQGGMGKVYRATDIWRKRTVAIKFLKPELSRKTELVERFKQEAELAKTIEHENVCKVFSVETNSQGKPCFVMELLDGETLSELLKREKPLAIGRTLHIAYEILQALKAAHSKGIVHRDLKPGNIFIARDGANEKVKILDFGISKIIDQETGSITQSEIPVGTPYYMAPEQAAGEEGDHRIDIYALGVIVYEMITGRRPFSQGSRKAVMFKHPEKAPISPRRINSNIPKALERFILRALNRDPNRRYDSIDTMLHSFEQVMPFAMWNRESSETSDVTVQDLTNQSMKSSWSTFRDSHSRSMTKTRIALSLLFLAAVSAILILWLK